MTEFRFRMPLDWKLSSYHTSSIFLVGLDGIPWPCKSTVVNVGEAGNKFPILHVVRNQPESGKLYFIFPLQKRGEMLICTGTIPADESEQEFDLVTELARGTLNRLRNQISIWQEGGLEIADSIHDTVSESIRCLGKAIMTEDKSQQDRLATDSLELAMDAIFDLSAAFGEQISKFRRENDFSQFWMANAIGTGEQMQTSCRHREFDLVQIESADDYEAISDVVTKRLVVGPWLDASVGGLSEELVQASDFASRRGILLAQCRKRLEQLPETTSLLHLVSGLNGIGHRHLSYPQQQQIAGEMMQLVDDSLVNVPVMVSFDYPWAERLAGSVGGVHPLQIADTLLRQGPKLSFLGLEINLDFWPNGSMVRDPLQWIDLIDIWTQLDLPLILCLRVPSNSKPIPCDEPVDQRVNQQRSNLTELQRLELLETVLPMMVSRPTIHGIIWRQWQDGDDPRFVSGGIIDHEGLEKPIGGSIASLRSIIGEKS